MTTLEIDEVAVETIDVPVGDQSIRAYVAGEGTPVVCLHGFPDSAQLWRHVTPTLVAAGHRVVALDLRGFGGSSKPQEVSEYSPTKVMADVIAAMQALDARSAHVVGHDFGALLAWMLGALTPKRVRTLTVISVAHPAVWASPTLEQRARFWYSLLYMLPEAEDIVRHQNWQLAREMLGNEREADRYLADLRRPGALRAGLNWYRAFCHPALDLQPRRPFPPVRVPTLAMWGAGDQALTEQAMLDSRRHVHGPWRYERIDDAGHFVPTDSPGRVSELVLDWIGADHGAPVADGARRRYARRS